MLRVIEDALETPTTFKPYRRDTSGICQYEPEGDGRRGYRTRQACEEASTRTYDCTLQQLADFWCEHHDPGLGSDMVVYLRMLQSVLTQWDTVSQVENLHDLIPSKNLCDRVMVSTQSYEQPKRCTCFSDEGELGWCERCGTCVAAEERYVTKLGIVQVVDELYATVDSIEEDDVPDHVETWFLGLFAELENLSDGLRLGFGGYNHGSSNQGDGCPLGICRARAIGW